MIRRGKWRREEKQVQWLQVPLARLQGRKKEKEAEQKASASVSPRLPPCVLQPQNPNFNPLPSLPPTTKRKLVTGRFKKPLYRSPPASILVELSSVERNENGITSIGALPHYKKKKKKERKEKQRHMWSPPGLQNHLTSINHNLAQRKEVRNSVSQKQTAQAGPVDPYLPFSQPTKNLKKKKAESEKKTNFITPPTLLRQYFLSSSFI